ncbi:MAG: hypothetical protein Q4P71_01525 [Actinomycetaceae bacterium]|nr:hypothetical protein [Actinomycetaceae bacterium]
MTIKTGDNQVFPESTSVDTPTKNNRAFMVIGISVVSVLVVAFIAVKLINAYVFAPQTVVKDYWKALENGQVSHAQKLEVNPEKSPLLSNAAYGAVLNRPSGVSVNEGELAPEVDDRPAYTYSVTYQIGDEDHSTTTTVVKTGKKLGLFDQWRVYDPQYGTLEIVSATAVEINGEVQVKGGKFGVYPGTYTMDDLIDSPYFEVVSEPAAIAVGETKTMELGYELTDKSKEMVTDALRDQLEECNAVVSNDPNPCDLRIFVSPEAKFDFEWSVPTEPSDVTFTLVEGGELAWTFEMAEPVKAVGRATPKPGTSDLGDPRDSTQDVTLGGRISLSDPQKPQISVERIVW